jgi:hypothetical protein
MIQRNRKRQAKVDKLNGHAKGEKSGEVNWGMRRFASAVHSSAGRGVHRLPGLLGLENEASRRSLRIKTARSVKAEGGDIRPVHDAQTGRGSGKACLADDLQSHEIKPVKAARLCKAHAHQLPLVRNRERHKHPAFEALAVQMLRADRSLNPKHEIMIVRRSDGPTVSNISDRRNGIVHGGIQLRRTTPTAYSILEKNYGRV